MKEYENRSTDLTPIIDSSIEELCYNLPVEPQFMLELLRFFTTTNMYLYGSSNYVERLNSLLNVGNNKDHLYELLTSFYMSLILKGMDFVNFKYLGTWILKIKDFLPGDTNIKQREGLISLLEKNDNPNLFAICLLILHYNANKLIVNLNKIEIEKENKKVGGTK